MFGHVDINFDECPQIPDGTSTNYLKAQYK